MIEWLRIIFIGIIEGITEWLPISSTGHMILVDSFWTTKAPDVITPEFWRVFEVVIQLGAILAVVTLFFGKLNPFARQKSPAQRKDTFLLWLKVAVGCIPAGIAGFFLDDWMDANLHSAYIVAAMLILYGVLFLVFEQFHQQNAFSVSSLSRISFGMAFGIGLFQILALVPGTSRSGVTILGAMVLGCSRYVATEFTFFLAIPVMLGASLIRLMRFFLAGGTFTFTQLMIVVVGMVTAYLVSIFTIRFLLNYLKTRDFKVFGVYRIVLGIFVFAVFFLTGK